MAGGQAIEGEGVTRRPAFNVPPELLVFDVEDEHVLYELDRERVEDLDEDLILSIMAVGIRVPVEVAVEKDPKGNKRYVVTDVAIGTRETYSVEAEALAALAVHARELESEAALGEIEAIVRRGNDARWMRESFAGSRSLPDLVWRQVERLRAGQ